MLSIHAIWGYRTSQSLSSCAWKTGKSCSQNYFVIRESVGRGGTSRSPQSRWKQWKLSRMHTNFRKKSKIDFQKETFQQWFFSIPAAFLSHTVFLATIASRYTEIMFLKSDQFHKNHACSLFKLEIMIVFTPWFFWSLYMIYKVVDFLCALMYSLYVLYHVLGILLSTSTQSNIFLMIISLIIWI